MTITVQDLSVAYQAVPKAACSSVKAALALLDSGVTTPLEAMARDNRRIHRIYQTSRFQLNRWRRYRNHFRFTVVREPVRRLLSVYTNRVIAKQELPNSPRLRKSGLPLDPDPDFFFQNLVPYMACSSVIKHHALHTYHFTGRDLSLYSKVYRTSDLDRLADDLSAHARREVTIPRFNSSEDALDFDALQPATRDAIMAYLEPEFELLGALFPRMM